MAMSQNSKCTEYRAGVDQMSQNMLLNLTDRLQCLNALCCYGSWDQVRLLLISSIIYASQHEDIIDSPNTPALYPF